MKQILIRQNTIAQMIALFEAHLFDGKCSNDEASFYLEVLGSLHTAQDVLV